MDEPHREETIIEPMEMRRIVDESVKATMTTGSLSQKRAAIIRA